MATIFPGSASAGQIFDGYSFNGTAWDIIGIDLTEDYQPRVANISDTEIGYLNGVTSSIQTQLDDKSTASKTETLSNKTLTTPTINGPAITAIGQTPTIHGIYLPAPHNIIFEGTTANEFETTLEPGEPTADRTITLPDQTGTVQLRVTDVSDTEIGYLNGVTSAIQTQIDSKLSISSASTTYATKTELNNIDALPSQTGNTGKYLTTNGSVASWSTIDLTGAINTASAAAVTYLVDSAPGTLDTLNELAAALGDDANYASTITTALGNKLNISSASTTYAPLSSPTFTGSVTVGEAITKTTSTALTSSSATTIATFPLAYGKCIAVECVVLISSESTGSYTASKILITADPDFNSIADITEYAIMSSRDDSLFPVLTASISGQNVLLKAAVSNFTATTAKVISTHILSPLGAA